MIMVNVLIYKYNLIFILKLRETHFSNIQLPLGTNNTQIIGLKNLLGFQYIFNKKYNNFFFRKRRNNSYFLFISVSLHCNISSIYRII
jgi:hypothetical protein